MKNLTNTCLLLLLSITCTSLMAQNDSTRLQKFESRAGFQFYDTQELKPVTMTPLNIDSLQNEK